MMPLDVVEDLDGSYVILVGSGDREKPLLGFDAAYGVDQLLLQDHGPPTDPDWLTAEMRHLQRGDL